MSTTDRMEFVSVTDTAKLIRKQLKQRWPDVRFSVRSDKYAGGASIDIRWTDGPTEPVVDRIVKGYAGARFDGMIDMATYVSSWLEEDGTAHTAHDVGTAGQKGSRDEFISDPQTGGARLVHFGADYVFCTRTESAEHIENCTAYVERDAGMGAERCEGCGDWTPGRENWHIARFWDARRDQVRISFVCSVECGGRLIARHTAVL